MGKCDPKPVLDEGLKLLSSFKVWLSAGTALGFYRDGGFIPHDTDIDIGLLADWDNPPDQIDIVHTMGGFKPIRIMHRENRVMQVAFVRNKVLFDIYLFYQGWKADLAVNLNDAGQMEKPLRFLTPLGTITYGETAYPVPNPIEEYLEYRYKDWRTPTDGKTPWYKDAAPGLLKQA
jgi:hypothetical protein